jgi:hypothetical protein
MRTFVPSGKIPTQHDRFRGVNGLSTRDNRAQAVAEVRASIPVFDRQAGLSQLAELMGRAARGGSS